MGGEDFEWASTPEERTRLWTARHKAYFAGMQTAPAAGRDDRHLRADLAARRDHRRVGRRRRSTGLPYYIVGHVGDGNFHPPTWSRRATRISGAWPSA